MSTEQEPDDVRQAAEDLIAAFQPLVEHIHRVATDLRPARSRHNVNLRGM